MLVGVGARWRFREAVVNPAPVFDRVYAAIRDGIASGQWRPGQRIELALLCDLLDVSPSPVRDALHRLRGERLLMDGDGEGFSMPSLTEAELVDRYGWVHQLVTSGLRGDGPLGPVGESGEPAEAIAALFEAIVDATCNAECREAMKNINVRLNPVRLAESGVIHGVADEIDGMRRAVEADDRPALRAHLARYRRRRMRAAAAVVYRMHHLDRGAG